MTFEEEVDYWCEEFPSLSREEITATLKQYDDENRT